MARGDGKFRGGLRQCCQEERVILCPEGIEAGIEFIIQRFFPKTMPRVVSQITECAAMYIGREGYGCLAMNG